MFSRFHHATPDEVRRITRLYILALSVIAALSITGQVLIQRQLDQQHADAKVINVAGRQRMLSQRLSKCVLILTSPDAWPESELIAARSELRATLEQWRRSHHGLQAGDEELGLPGRLSADVTRLFREVDLHFDQLYQAAAPLLSSNGLINGQSEAMQVRQHEAKFLDGMDAIVSQLEYEAETRVERLQSLEWLLLVFMLVALTLEGLFIFRPGVRRIQSTIETIRRVSNDLIRARDAAESASRAKTQFLAKVSHELRTPLHAVRGATELLLLKESDSRRREYLLMAEEAAQALSALVEDLLDLSQVESDTLKLTHEPFDLHATLERVMRMVRPRAQKKGLSSRLVTAADLPQYVRGDEFRLQQVLLNLLVNAVKFTQDGEVALHAFWADGVDHAVGGPTVLEATIRFEVTDTGMGIPDGSQQVIFEKFTQLTPSSRGDSSGIGLGLSIVAQLVKLMKGQIRVLSKMGEGSIFSVDLPLVLVAADMKPKQQEVIDEPVDDCQISDSRSQKPRLRILVADDTLTSRQIVKAMLVSLGHEVTVVDDGAQAFREYSQSIYDAVLLDMQMPEWDGIRTANAIRDFERKSGFAHTPLLLLSAASNYPSECHDLFDAHLTKPVSLQTLQAELTRCVSRRSTSNPSPRGSAEPSSLALQRMGGNRELYDEICQAFFDHLPHQIAELHAAVESQADQISVVAHRLYGQLLMLDFQDAAAVAHAMEEVGQRGCDSDPALLKELLVQFERLLRQLPAGPTSGGLGCSNPSHRERALSRG